MLIKTNESDLWYELITQGLTSGQLYTLINPNYLKEVPNIYFTYRVFESGLKCEGWRWLVRDEEKFLAWLRDNHRQVLADLYQAAMVRVRFERDSNLLP